MNYAYVQEVQRGKDIIIMTSDIARYGGKLYRVLICGDTEDELLKYPNLQMSYKLCECMKEGKDIMIKDIFTTEEKEPKEILITETKKKLLLHGVDCAMNFFVDEKGNSRRKSVLTEIIGKEALRILLPETKNKTYMSQKDARKLCKVLGRDLKQELLDYFRGLGVTNSLELLEYRKRCLPGYFLNQFYINALLDDEKKEGHITLGRTMELIDGLGLDIYDDIISTAKQENRRITDVILKYFWGNNNPLDEIVSIVGDRGDELMKAVIWELIKDIERLGITRSEFVMTDRTRLQTKLAGINLYRRLYMILGVPVRQLTPSIKRKFSNVWKEYQL